MVLIKLAFSEHGVHQSYGLDEKVASFIHKASINTRESDDDGGDANYLSLKCSIVIEPFRPFFDPYQDSRILQCSLTFPIITSYTNILTIET